MSAIRIIFMGRLKNSLSLLSSRFTKSKVFTGRAFFMLLVNAELKALSLPFSLICPDWSAGLVGAFYCNVMKLWRLAKT